MTPPQPMAGYVERAGRFAGLYAPTFMVRETSLEKLLTLTVQFWVTADAAGVVMLQILAFDAIFGLPPWARGLLAITSACK